MLHNVSYNRPKIKAEIDAEVGRAFNWIDRFKMKGIGSGRLQIHSCSIQIHNLLVLDNNANVCGIELRPNGIILSFRSLLETYALVIPLWKLKIYKGQAEVYSVYRDNYFVKIKATEKRHHQFMQKIIQYKAENYDAGQLR
ncbi:MAG: hypothetical protein ACQESK_05240 [Bacteroidota bacterium]